jgi:Holliday junction resolvase RusA-like endonuclease
LQVCEATGAIALHRPTLATVAGAHILTRQTFGLDRIVVEYKSLGPSKPFAIQLPMPPSTNALFGQAPGRKRFTSKEYADWQVVAGSVLKNARPPKFPAQVFIGITLQDSGNLDGDNRIKAPLDLLVKHGVIKDDSRKYVREIRLTWGNVTGCKIEIRPYSFSETGMAA